MKIYLRSPNGDRALISEVSEDTAQSALNSAQESKNELAGLFSHIVAAPFAVQEAGRFKVELETSTAKKLIGAINFLESESAAIELANRDTLKFEAQ